MVIDNNFVTLKLKVSYLFVFVFNVRGIYPLALKVIVETGQLIS